MHQRICLVRRIGSKEMTIDLRPAKPADVALLRHWDEQPHVIASDPNDDWNWEIELKRTPEWREQLIAQIDDTVRERSTS